MSSVKCKAHNPVQHRDLKEPWCDECGLNAIFKTPINPLLVSNQFGDLSIDTQLALQKGSDLQQKAKAIVFQYLIDKLEKTDPMPTFAVYIVWFSKVLQNWKALVSTTLPDGMYYEVTYNGDKGETYLDAYKKFDNVAIKD